MIKLVLPICTAFALMVGAVLAGDFFDAPDKNKPAGTSAAGTPAPSRNGASSDGAAVGTAVMIDSAPAYFPEGAELRTAFVGDEKSTAKAFRDMSPPKGALVGFEYTTTTNAEGGTILQSVVPVYLLSTGKVKGAVLGTRAPNAKTAVVEAKPGFAVGVVEFRGMGTLDAMRLTFFKYEAELLDPSEGYSGPWVGDSSAAPQLVRTYTKPVIGVTGKADAGINQFALLVKKEPIVVKSTSPSSNKPADSKGSVFGTKLPGVPSIPTNEQGILEPSGFDATLLKSSPGGAEKEVGTAFRDIVPAGGFLVGLEYTVGTTGGSASVGSLRPLFQLANGTKKIGDLHGTQVGTSNRLEARMGYAVGAVQVKGSSLVEGLQLTYMKIKGDALDPVDSYQSVWIGNSMNAGKDLTGSGQAVVGFYGSADKAMHTLGLLVRKTEPKVVAATPRLATGTPRAATPPPVAAATPPPGLAGDVQVFACADDEYTLFLNGQPILTGNDLSKVQTGKFKIVKGDVLSAVVTDKGPSVGTGEAWFALRVVKDGKTIMDAGDMTYLTKEPPSWKTSRMMSGFLPPKVWTQELTMGADTRVRAAWVGPKDGTPPTVYFKGLVP